MHMEFQVNILSSSGITRGDRPFDHPSDRPSDHPTLWIVGIRGESKNIDMPSALQMLCSNGGGGFRGMPFELSELGVAPVKLLRVVPIELGVTINSFQIKQFLKIF